MVSLASLGNVILTYEGSTDVATVTWAVCIIHWLTVGSTEVDERALALLEQGDAASNASSGLAPSVYSIRNDTNGPLRMDLSRLPHGQPCAGANRVTEAL